MSGHDWLQIYERSRQFGDVESLAGDYELCEMDCLRMCHFVLGRFNAQSQTKQHEAARPDRTSLIRDRAPFRGFMRAGFPE
jgi:hypothetical protein